VGWPDEVSCRLGSVLCGGVGLDGSCPLTGGAEVALTAAAGGLAMAAEPIAKPAAQAHASKP
jgi:hypothetical protein